MDAELNLGTTEGDFTLEQTEAYNLAQTAPEQAAQADVSPKVLFLASQLGMKATEVWQIRAKWISVYLQAVGTSSDY